MPLFIVRSSLLQKPEVHHHIRRSLSVPVNVKTGSLRRMDSLGGLIRVISTPRPIAADGAPPSDVPTTDTGMLMFLNCKWWMSICSVHLPQVRRTYPLFLYMICPNSDVVYHTYYLMLL